jgi:hypothetical protein
LQRTRRNERAVRQASAAQRVYVVASLELPSRQRTVWLVYQEYQADAPDMVGLFQSRRDAEEATEECRRWAREKYEWVVYGDEDEDGRMIAAWDVDVHVEEQEVEPATRRPRRRPRSEAT